MTQPKLKWARGPHLVEGLPGAWYAPTGPERTAMMLRVYEHTVEVFSLSVAKQWRRDQYGLRADTEGMLFVEGKAREIALERIRGEWGDLLLGEIPHE